MTAELSHQPLSCRLGYGAQGQSRARGAERSEGTLDGPEHRKIMAAGVGGDYFCPSSFPEPISQKHHWHRNSGDSKSILSKTSGKAILPRRFCHASIRTLDKPILG